MTKYPIRMKDALHKIRMELQSGISHAKEYYSSHEKRWKETGIDLDEVNYQKPSSNPELTNAHRNNAQLRLYKHLLELLD